MKQKFDEEVVFSDNAPDISNYQEYYEAIDPANAQVIYRQVLEQQKKDKEDKAMRENLDIGDEIVTAGGIIGRIVSIKDDTLVIETGSDRSKVRIAKWAVSQNLTAIEAKKQG